MISPGANVTEGQAVMELETDKAVIEVPSSVSGTVKDIRVKEGEKINVGQVIFTVENGTGTKTASPVEAAPTSKTQPTPAPATSKSAPAPQVSAPAASPQITSGPSEFTLPELGENVHQGDLVRLMV